MLIIGGKGGGGLINISMFEAFQSKPWLCKIKFKEALRKLLISIIFNIIIPFFKFPSPRRRRRLLILLLYFICSIFMIIIDIFFSNFMIYCFLQLSESTKLA